MVHLRDFLTDREIRQACALYRKLLPNKLNAALVAKIIKPNIDRINRDLEQENDPRYLAYAIEYIFMKQGVKRALKPKPHPSWGGQADDGAHFTLIRGNARCNE